MVRLTPCLLHRGDTIRMEGKRYTVEQVQHLTDRITAVCYSDSRNIFYKIFSNDELVCVEADKSSR
jgi:hypothetical protein